MFETGKSYKVKVELAEGQTGVGRATVVDKGGGRFFVSFRGAGDVNQTLSRGAKIWFVVDPQPSMFNGLWVTTVLATRIVGGQTVMECRAPKFEPMAQRRKSARVALSCPARIVAARAGTTPGNWRTFNISRSGVGLELLLAKQEDLHTGDSVAVVIDSPKGELAVNCRVIRLDENWLLRRTTAGLEFVDMDDETRARLNELVEELGEKAAGETETTTTGLSGRFRSERTTSSLLKREKPPAAAPDFGQRNGDEPEADE